MQPGNNASAPVVSAVLAPLMVPVNIDAAAVHWIYDYYTRTEVRQLATRTPWNIPRDTRDSVMIFNEQPSAKTTYYTTSFTNCKCYMVRCFVRFFYHFFFYFQDKMEKMSWSLVNICVRYFFCKFRILLRGYFFLWINVQIAQRYHFVFHLIIPLFYTLHQ